MKGSVGNRATYANVAATLALVVALGGGAYAVATIDSGDIVDGSIKSVDLKNGSGVTSVDVKDAASGSDAINADKLDGKSARDFAPARPEAWRRVGAPGQPGFNSGQDPAAPGQDQIFCYWTNYDSGAHNLAAFFKDSSGIVHLKGIVTAHDGFVSDCGSVSTEEANGWIFTLPKGYRPKARTVVTTLANNNVARLTIRPDGLVVYDDAVAGWHAATNWVSLDGTSFRAQN